MQSSLTKRLGFGIGAFGLVLSGYAGFVFDPTVSPMDMPDSYSGVTSSSSLDDRAAAVSDVTERFNRTLAGERTYNFERAAKQQRIFYFGVVLLIIGAGIVVFGFQQAKHEPNDDNEGYL